MPDLASLKVIVGGRVQGVSFRYFVQREAQALRLTGWVRNRPGGGEVEIEAEGEREKLERLFDRVKVGPPAAEVQKASMHWDDYSGQYPDFRIRF